MSKRLALREVYDPAKEKQLVPTVDLVLVHGLDGDDTESWTWRNNGSEVFWPRDLLPEARPRTRVLSFRYNAATFRSNTNTTIRDSARSLLGLLNVRRRNITDPGSRPLVFVGHCLGGLVVKQAMCFANSEPEYALIASATKGIIFFGTPHGGADKSSWKLVADGYSLLAGPLSSLVSAITRASDDLEEIKEDFVHLSPLYPITSFYETGYWGNTGKCIVSPTSARMMIGNEHAEAVDADHRAMCQFEDAEDAAFMVLCDQIAEAVGVDVVKGKDVGGKGTVGNVGAVMVKRETAELPLAGRHGSQTIPTSADGDWGMFGGNMGRYTMKGFVMIEERQVPADNVPWTAREDEERVMAIHDIPELKQPDSLPAASSTPVQPAEAFTEGRREGFLKRMNPLRIWG